MMHPAHPPTIPKSEMIKGNCRTLVVNKVTENKDNKCYLHVERVDDKFIVVDDLGDEK